MTQVVKVRSPLCALLVVAALGALALRARAQADSTWREHESALQGARKSNDTVEYRAQLNAIYRAVGTTPRIAVRYASLALDARDVTSARRWLTTLAAMGAEPDSSLATRYAALAGDAAAQALRVVYARATADVGAPRVVFHLPDPDMIAEDVAYDPSTARFLVSSVRRGRVYAMRTTGDTAASIWGDSSALGIFALRADAGRNTLWESAAALPYVARYAASDSGKSVLLECDLRTGAVRARYFAPDSGAHVLGDLTVGSDGTVYVADGQGGGVYALRAGDSALITLVPRGTFSSPQTPALSRDGRTLFVPDYSIGIAAVDIATGKFEWMTHSDSLALAGIDGLYRVGRDLVVVQNGLEPNRIMRLTLDARMRRVLRATTIARGPTARSLTHATVQGNWLYFIANSGWERAADDGSMKAGAPADAPAIMRIRLAP